MSITLPVIAQSVITLAPIVIFMLTILESGMIPDMVQLTATRKDRHDRREQPVSHHNRRRRLPIGPPALDRPGRALPGPADDGSRLDDRERRAALDPARTAFHAEQPDMGDRRLPDHVRGAAAARRAARRPGRAKARVLDGTPA